MARFLHYWGMKLLSLIITMVAVLGVGYVAFAMPTDSEITAVHHTR
jgi:hypothetical protein